MEWKPNGTMRLHPFELIQQESGIQVRYRYDWHIGAMPERYTYDKTGQKQPLNELALDLIPGDYGRAVCNGRFRDWDTGIKNKQEKEDIYYCNLPNPDCEKNYLHFRPVCAILYKIYCADRRCERWS